MAHRILIVDDDEMVRSSLESVLTMEGYQVMVADGGLPALRLLAESDVDLVVLDISMPDVDGWETLVRLKANHRTAALPVVALSGDARDSHQFRRAGFNAYLSKGGSLDQFLCTIRSALEFDVASAGVWLHSCNGHRCYTAPLGDVAATATPPAAARVAG